MDSTPGTNVLADALPDAFRKADTASANAQRRFLRLIYALLLANVAAAVSAGLGATGRWADRLALGGSGLFVVGLILASWLSIERPQRRWYESRAAGESAKTLAIQYAVGGGGFEVGVPNAAVEYRKAIAAIPSALPHLPPLGDMGDPVTPGLEAIRALPLRERCAIYLRDRVTDQRAWYAAKAAANDRLAMRWRSIMFGGQIVGVAGGVARAWGLWNVNLVGIAAALTTAAAAWLRTKEYEQLGEAYAVTQRELVKLEAEAPEPADEAEWAEFVSDAEAAFSREHTLWLARRIG